MIEPLVPAATNVAKDILEGRDAWPDIAFTRTFQPSASGLLLILTILLGSALFLLLFGRWIPEGDTPRCRECGHDLTGTDGSTRCPECGQELPAGCIRTSLGSGAVVRRRFVRRVGRWWSFACLILIPIIVLLHPGRLPLTPDAWLGTVDVRIARLLPERMTWPFYNEIRVRGVEGRLSNRTLDRVAASILSGSRETGRHHTWRGGMAGGDIVGAAWSAGLLDLDDILVAGPFQPTLAESSFDVLRAMDGMIQARIALWGRASRTGNWSRPIPGVLWIEIQPVSARIGDVPASGETRRIARWPDDGVVGVRVDLSPEEDSTFESGPRDGSVEIETRLKYRQGEETPRVIGSRTTIFDFSTTIASTEVPTSIHDISTCMGLERDLARHSRVEIDAFLRPRLELAMSRFHELELGVPTIEIVSNRDDFTLTQSVPWEAARARGREVREIETRRSAEDGGSGTKRPEQGTPEAILLARWDLPVGFLDDGSGTDVDETVRVLISTSLPEPTAWVGFLSRRHHEIHGGLWGNHAMETTDRVLICNLEIEIPVVRSSIDDVIEETRRHPAGDP